MSTLNDPGQLDDAVPSGAETCERCDAPGELVRTDHRAVVYLCATHQSAQLRRRLPWRQYRDLAIILAAAVPFLALYTGVVYDAFAATRSDAGRTDRSLPEALAYGWGILTAATDHWVSLGIATAVVIALPVSLVVIASQGEAVANRVEQATVSNLDDDVRLLYLDNALVMFKGIAILTTVLTLIIAIDAIIDEEPGGAQPALFSLILTAVLVVEIVKLNAFPDFASKSHLKVTADLARGVSGRREYARSLGWAQGAIALAITLSLLVLSFVAATFPGGLAAVGTGLVLTLPWAVCAALLAGLAYLYLHRGDRPSGLLLVGVGIFFGMFWASMAYELAYSKHYHLVTPWGVLVGSASFVPVYLLVAIGLVGTGPLKALAYFTARIEDATTKFNQAVREARASAGSGRSTP